MRPANSRPTPASRGFTLIEMLVVVALVVLLMTILVSIFSAATGAITVSRINTELDQSLRMLDGTLRRDLGGVTAHLTPGRNDPKDNVGYFEYGENAFADLQGEDTDDYIAFTAKAPAGQPFSGRILLQLGTPGFAAFYQAVPVTSEYAEIIYFLRAGKLYRRVLLIAPERASQMVGYTFGQTFRVNGNFVTSPAGVGNFVTSWQGLNDISARPSPINQARQVPPTPNSLGTLTNRHNRYARQRFSDDYFNNFSLAFGADGLPDDVNGDGTVDYYPTVYPNIYSFYRAANGGIYVPTAPTGVAALDVLAFPFVYPHAYSKLDGTSAAGGPLHSLDPTGTTFNHAPLDIGDSLPVPQNANQLQSWFGFPTWKETLSYRWTDPYQPPNLFVQQSPGLTLTAAAPPIAPLPLRTRLTPVGGTLPAAYAPLPFSDGAGSPGINNNNTFDFYTNQLTLTGNAYDPDTVWEDDLIMTGVRSFDVKAYEGNAQVYDATNAIYRFLGSGYYDLGYLTQWDARYALGYVGGANGANQNPPDPVRFNSPFGHEGRIPPLTTDYRTDPQWPFPLNSNWPNGLFGDNTAGLSRLRRVFDTWSTDYMNAPKSQLGNAQSGPPYLPPYYPSFPPPYAAPLRGIQIQIRVVDPTNQHIKVLTIRQDFTDKL